MAGSPLTLPAHTLMLVPPPEDGERTLAEAFEKNPELRTASFLTAFREALARVLNQVIAEDKKRKPEVAAEKFRQSLRLGICAIMESRRKKGMSGEEGVLEYVKNLDIAKIYAAGAKTRLEYIDKPFANLHKNNCLPGDDEPLSLILVRCMTDDHDRDGAQFADDNFRRCMTGDIRTMDDVNSAGRTIQLLRRVLGMASLTGVNKNSIKQALRPDIESGLSHLMDLLQEHVGFLEMGVFTAAYRSRHGIQGVTPLTFKAEEAKRFFLDFAFEENKVTMKEDAIREYGAACDKAFPNPADASVARMILWYYFEALRESMQLNMFVVNHFTSPEYYFPVHQLSENVMFLGKVDDD